MQAQQAILTFSEAERPTGTRLLKIAIEIDRIEGYSEAHAIAIARMAEKIGAQMGLHGVDLTALKFAALAHDLGERAMKRNYLLRPSVLSWEETLDLWRHPILGEQVASELRLSRQIQLLIRWHHEWWNGRGYPDGLAGEMIPLGARILRAVDSYFALVSNRPHRQRHDRLEAEQMIADLAGIEFDPLVVKLLLQTLADERASEAEFVYPSSEPVATFSEPAPEAALAQPTIHLVEPQLIEPTLETEPAESGQLSRYNDATDFQSPDEIAPAPARAERRLEKTIGAFDATDAQAPAEGDERQAEERAAESEEARERIES
jgi:hypothetical protein